MNARTKARLVAFLAAEIAAAARRITDDAAERDDALAHIELQISFIREVTSALAAGAVGALGLGLDRAETRVRQTMGQ
jgi:hypothetical protein